MVDQLMIRRLITVLAMFLPIAAASADPTQLTAHVGDIYEIVRVSDSSQSTGDGSSGSSHDKNTLMERVIAVREDGLELEYDLPKAATEMDRTRNWQVPVRVLKRARGQMQLLNRPDLETRINIWLKLAKLPRSACGHWIFTWHAFRIECDPQSVIQMLAPFDLRPDDLRNGGIYQDSRARAPATLSQTAAGSNGSTFVVELAVDPETVRREKAESDVVVAEITGKSLTLDTALRARSTEQISGTITITFNTDSAGQVQRRTKISKLEIKRANGKSETQTVTETMERRLLQD
jgi:hypothetical protein